MSEYLEQERKGMIPRLDDDLCMKEIEMSCIN